MSAAVQGTGGPDTDPIGGSIHLIHIGLPKTGSTFLQNWFAEHPDIAYRSGAIAGLADVYQIAREGASPSPFKVRVTSSELLSVGYSRAGLGPDFEREGRVDSEAQRRTCAILAALFPSAHILLVTRGFRAMILSAYSELVRQGGVEEFWDPLPDVGAGTANVWNFDALAALYRAAFGERLILLPYELLRDDPAAFVGEIERRLGIAQFPPGAGRVNAALSPVEMRWYPRLSRLVRRLPVGDRLRRVLFRRYVPRIGGRKLGALIRLLERIRPARPLRPNQGWEEAVVSKMRGMADTLKNDPLYAPYAADYLFDASPGAAARDAAPR